MRVPSNPWLPLPNGSFFAVDPPEGRVKSQLQRHALTDMTDSLYQPRANPGEVSDSQLYCAEPAPMAVPDGNRRAEGRLEW